MPTCAGPKRDLVGVCVSNVGAGNKAALVYNSSPILLPRKREKVNLNNFPNKAPRLLNLNANTPTRRGRRKDALRK